MSDSNIAGSPSSNGSAQATEGQPEYTLVQDASIGDLDAFINLSDDEANQYAHDTNPEERGVGQTQSSKADQGAGQPPVSRNELDGLKAELEALRAERVHLQSAFSESQKFIGRQSSEIGELRKRLQENNEKLQAGLQEKMVDDPTSALRDFQQIQDNERRLEAIDDYENKATKRQEVLSIVQQRIPENVSVDDMALVLQRDGMPDEFIESFKKDPIGFARYDPIALTLIGKRAEEQRAIVALASGYQAAAKRIAELEAQLKAIPTSMLQRISNASKGARAINGASTKPASKGSEGRLDAMSDESLEQILRQPG